MPENTNEQTEIRRDKIDTIEKGDVAVTSHDHAEEAELENNSASQNVIRIEDLLTTKIDNPVIRKLNRLKNVGLTDEMILNTYDDLAGKVTSETEAISVLKIIFDRYVEYISELPNGIVLDPLSGRIDYEKSYEQRLEIGILKDPFEGIDTTKKISFDDILNIDREALEKGFKEYAFECEYLSASFVESLKKQINSQENKDDFENFLDNIPEETSLSETLQDFLEELQASVAVSKYEQDPFLFEITQIEYSLEDSIGTEVKPIYLEKRREFYKNHSEYKGKVPIRTSDGKIDPSEARKFEQYKDNYEDLYILSRINEYNKMSPEERQNMPQDKRQIFLIATITALQHYRKKNPEYKEIVSESQAILKAFYPELDFSNVRSKRQQELFAEIARNELGANEDIKSLGFEALIYESKIALTEAIKDYLINDQTHIFDKDFNDISMQMIDKNDKNNALEKYFVGSKITLSKDEVESYDHIYKILTVQSWLEDKDSALKMRYAALTSIKEEYESQADNPYIARKLDEINKQLNEFTFKHGNLGLDTEEKKAANLYEFSIYREYMVNANVMKYYTKDAINAQNGMIYHDLDEMHKKAYIRNTLVGLEFVDNNLNFSLSKMVMRRLEQMNNDTKKFITFDRDGKPTINKELILQEYSAMSEYKYESFGELLASAQIRKNDYILNKLETYSELEANKFLQLKDKDNIEGAISEIEEHRAKGNVKEKRHVVVKRGLKTVRPSVYRVEGGSNFRTRSYEKVTITPISNEEMTRPFEESSEEMDVSAIEAQKHKNNQRKIDGNFENSQVEANMEIKREPNIKPANSNHGVNEFDVDSDYMSSDENIGAVTTNNFAVSNEIIPKEETSQIQKIKKMFANIIKKIKNTLLPSKKDKDELQGNTINNSEQKNEQTTSNNTKGKNWLQREESLSLKKQQEIAEQSRRHQEMAEQTKKANGVTKDILSENDGLSL